MRDAERHPTFRIGELRHGILGLGDAFAQSLALLSLALASSFATSGRQRLARTS